MTRKRKSFHRNISGKKAMVLFSSHCQGIYHPLVTIACVSFTFFLSFIPQSIISSIHSCILYLSFIFSPFCFLCHSLSTSLVVFFHLLLFSPFSSTFIMSFHFLASSVCVQISCQTLIIITSDTKLSICTLY